MIEKIRAAKSWRERAEIAKDELPGTTFDGLFSQAKTAWEMETKFPTITAQILEKLEARNPATARKIRRRLGERLTLGEVRAAWEKETGYPAIPRQIHERLGTWLTRQIQNGRIQVLHDLADALAKWKRHKPKPNFELIALFSMSGMFPPGWTKTWGKDASGKLVPGYAPPAPGTRDIIAMRDIKASLAKHDPNFSEKKWESSRRKIQKYAKEFKILLDDSPGRPPQKTRRDSRKKLR
jgi:hypothetical protein